MKLYVVTNARGRILGALPAPGHQKADGPSPGRPMAMRGQRVHEVEYSGSFDATTDIAALHERLAAMLHKPHTTASKKPAARRR